MTAARRAAASAAAAVLALLVAAGPAVAHTELASADPEPDAQVDDLDGVTLVFEGALAPDGDHEIGLFDGDTRLDTSDTEMVDEQTIATDLTGPASAGELTVRWVIVAADGDEQRGEHTFVLTAPVDATASPSPTPTPRAATPEPSATPSPEPTPTPGPTTGDAAEVPAGRVDPTGPGDDDAGPVSPAALGVAGLAAAAVLGAAVVAVRQRR